jgi:hypothetical protein
MVDLVNRVSPSGVVNTNGGGVPPLVSVLTAGNITGANDIIITDNAKIISDAASSLTIESLNDLQVNASGEFRLESSAGRVVIVAEQVLQHAKNSADGVALSNGESLASADDAPVTSLSSGGLTNAASIGIKVGAQDPNTGGVVGGHGWLYIRAEGASSNIYQMRSGVWVAL